MKRKRVISFAAFFMLLIAAGWLSADQYFTKSRFDMVEVDGVAEIKGCVFKTAFEGEGVESEPIYLAPEKVTSSIDEGLHWLSDAQAPNGGYGAGLHSAQHIRDPHAVKTDPATTSMVAMALMRSGSTLTTGPYKKELNLALDYLLSEVEGSEPNHSNITSVTGTQIQAKLGANIDVVLTSQCLSNILDHTGHDPALRKRVKAAVEKCVAKIENAIASNGAVTGSGWAGVLQSSFAVNALEMAQSRGADAMKLKTAYKVNRSAQKMAQKDEVMVGYGNNGGEEFLSFLQTGEGLVMSGDDAWKDWYDNMSNRLLDIQNRDGSWNGHHCITSPVFCTATCLLILSVNNDIESLRQISISN